MDPINTAPERAKAVIIISGGLDSTSAMYTMSPYIDFVHAVSFNYGQRHQKELEYAERACSNKGIPWSLIDLWSSGLTDLLSESGSSLVSDTEVPDGHYGEESMKKTVVPNRNMIMLSIAAGVAVAKGATFIVTGVHSGDHFIYPDCRPDFVAAASEAIRLGNEGFSEFNQTPILAPWMQSTKADIAYNAIASGLKFEDTWSCYKGGEIHCGRCGTCVERIEAIQAAIKDWKETYDQEIIDDTEYADNEFWKEALQRETV